MSHLGARWRHVSRFCSVYLFGKGDVVVNWSVNTAERTEPGWEFSWWFLSRRAISLLPHISASRFPPHTEFLSSRQTNTDSQTDNWHTQIQPPSVFPPQKTPIPTPSPCQTQHCSNPLLKQTGKPPPKFSWITLQFLEPIQSQFEDNGNTEY